MEPLRFAEMTESDRDVFIRGCRSPPEDFSLDLSDTDDVLEKEVIGTASPPDCDKWSYSIEVLLADPAGLEVFRTFLRSVRREESLSFWMAAKMFRDDAGLQNGGLSENMGLQARSIFTQYLQGNASQLVLIRDSTARKVSAALRAKKVAGDLFVEAQAEAVARMTERDYPEFLRSEIFRRYVEKASLRRQQSLDSHSHSSVLPTYPVDDNGESTPNPSDPTSLWPLSSSLSPPISDMHSAGDNNTAILTDMTSNKEESSSVCSDRRPRTSKREPGAIAVDDLPRETSADLVPRPRNPERRYKPEEFFRLLSDRLKEVIRNRELPAVLGGKRRLADIQEQSEQTDLPHIISETEFLAVPPVSTCVSDVSSEGSLVSQVSAESAEPATRATAFRKERISTTKRMPPTDSGHHSDLVSSVEDLMKAASMSETHTAQKHRHFAQKRYEHLHHHNHLHHHYSGVPPPNERWHHTAPSDLSVQKSKCKRSFASQSTLSDSDRWAMASPDQRSVFSSSSAETLSLTYERQQYTASDTSSILSYRSNPECHPMVYGSRGQYEPVSPLHMRGRSQHPSHGHHYRLPPSARGIEIIYKINGGDKFKQYLPGPTVTLGDFKALVKGMGQYIYFFAVKDDCDPDPIFEEFRNDLDILPIYNGRIIGRLRPLRID